MTKMQNRRPGLYKSDPDEIPPYKKALIRYKDVAKQSYINSVKAGNDLEWDYWSATIEYGSRAKFDNLWDFFANLPSLQKDFQDESVTQEWYWKKINPIPLSNEFYYRPEILRILRAKAGPDSMIEEGWMLKYESGQIDTETTWSDTSHLIATNSFFTYFQIYMHIIH